MAKVWAYFDHAAASTTARSGRSHYRLPEDERIASLEKLGVIGVRAAGVPAQAGHGPLAHRVGHRLRRAHAGRGADGHALPRTRRRRLPGHRRRGGRPDREGARPGRRRSTRATTLLRAGVGPARRSRRAGGGALRRTARSAARTPGSTCSARCWPQHPRLPVVLAHAGMPDFAAALDLGRRYEHVHLDTTMVGTAFTEAITPLPADWAARLADDPRPVVFGTDFPNIPYAVRRAGGGRGARGRRPTTASVPRSCAPCCTTPRRGCSASGPPDPARPTRPAHGSGCSHTGPALCADPGRCVRADRDDVGGDRR